MNAAWVRITSRSATVTGAPSLNLLTVILAPVTPLCPGHEGSTQVELRVRLAGQPLVAGTAVSSQSGHRSGTFSRWSVWCRYSPLTFPEYERGAMDGEVLGDPIGGHAAAGRRQERQDRDP